MNILLAAYACIPNAGTEPGHGWNWAIHLAERGLSVTVLTRTEAREAIDAYLREHPTPNLHFAYVTLPTRRSRPGRSLHYALWQWYAVKTARALLATQRFDVVHHVTYGSVHLPTRLWQLGLPTIFGPVGGGQTAPPNMLSYFGSSRRSEQLRTLFTKALAYSPWHRRWIRKMSAVLAVNQDTVDLLHRMGRPEVLQEFDIAIPRSFLASQPRTFPAVSSPLRLLWVGRIVPRKGLPLALDALAKSLAPSTLTIIGDGPDEATIRRMIADRGLTDRVFWAARRLPWTEVRAAYLDHDALLFTSLRETCGAQLLEAMALGLPVITLDHHGPRDLVPEQAGFKVPVTDPAGVVRDLAAAIDRFATLSSAEKDSMSSAGWNFAAENTWTAHCRIGAPALPATRRDTISSLGRGRVIMPDNKVCAVVVTFHPGAKDIANLEKLRSQVESLVVVDNGSSEQHLQNLRPATRACDAVLLENGANLGIAAALNTGVRWAMTHQQDWIVLLDQDSTVTDGFIDGMLYDFKTLPHGSNVMQMIPRYLDPDSGKEETIAMGPDGGPFITQTSGSLFPIQTFERCGLFTEELFIYCVDDDYSLRLRSMGFSIAQSQRAVLLHYAGKPTRVSILGKSFTTRNYRPEVQYYWSRNRVWLVRKYGRRYPHLLVSSLKSLVGVPLKIALGEKRRALKIRMFLRGILDGVLGRTGQRIDILT